MDDRPLTRRKIIAATGFGHHLARSWFLIEVLVEMELETLSKLQRDFGSLLRRAANLRCVSSDNIWQQSRRAANPTPHKRCSTCSLKL
jgi:hypothetical protein